MVLDDIYDYQWLLVNDALELLLIHALSWILQQQQAHILLGCEAVVIVASNKRNFQRRDDNKHHLFYFSNLWYD